MKKIKLLIIGYSKFVEKRLIKSIKKIKKIDYRVCSKSKKNKTVYYKDYLELDSVYLVDPLALKLHDEDIVLNPKKLYYKK